MLHADWATIGGPQARKISRIPVSRSTRLADSMVKVCKGEGLSLVSLNHQIRSAWLQERRLGRRFLVTRNLPTELTEIRLAKFIKTLMDMILHTTNSETLYTTPKEVNLLATPKFGSQWHRPAGVARGCRGVAPKTGISPGSLAACWDLPGGMHAAGANARQVIEG